MNKTKRRTVITIEQRRLTLICSRRSPPLAAWCAACGARVPMLNPDEAAAIRRVTPRTIYRWVEAGRLHFTEVHNGYLLICLRSLVSDEDPEREPG